MLRILLAKDLRRAWRNPLPWLLNLIVPLAMTALLGLVFGAGSDSGALGRIHFAVVNEDQAMLSSLLRGVTNQVKGGLSLDPVFLARDEALREVNAGKISAVLLIETNFTRDYLTARAPVRLQLIKNPAESIHPAVLEELSGAVVTALNGLSRNVLTEVPAWQAVLAGQGDYLQVPSLLERAGDKLKAGIKIVYPPLVSYESGESKLGTNQIAAPAGATAPGRSSGSIFAYLLLGLSAMFLLFLGSNAMADLHREIRNRTFERYRSLRQPLWPFLVSKLVFGVVMLLFCSAVMLGGGGLIFHIHWSHYVALGSLVFAYAGFVAALFAVLVALMPDERRAAVLNNLASMALGLVGGCAFPPRQLPAFLREHLSPLLPSYWFSETLRNLECGSGDAPWLRVLLQLLVVTAGLVGLAAVLFQRRFNAGQRA